MPKFHTTVSRRDFMKALGLTGATLGAAGLVAPQFHDLDEVVSSAGTEWKKPWWVKDRDFENPTMEIDWDVLNRFDRAGKFGAGKSTEWDSKVQELYAMVDSMYGTRDTAELNKKWAQEKVPGMTHRDQALDNATAVINNGARSGYSGLGPEELGVAKWQGTPEENLHMMRVAARFFGSISQGVWELNGKTEKAMWAELKLPTDTRNAFVLAVRHPQLAMRTAPGQVTNPYGYLLSTNAMAQTQQFVKNMGYKVNNLSCGAGVNTLLSGIGEISRTGINCIMPQHGNVLRRSDSFLTDFDLAPTPPIDAGISRFCKTCKKCADTCVPQAISFDDEPSWEVGQPYLVTGIKHYDFLYPKCNTYKSNWAPGYCGVCLANCPFTSILNDGGMIHTLIKATTSATPLFNGFFRNMDDFMGYGQNRGGLDVHSRDNYVEQFWATIGPEFGFLTHTGYYPH
ncbi:MAG: reductive dehalogenase [Dehalogenimonas sp.]